MSKLEIVSMVRIDGIWYQQEELPADEFKRLLEAKITDSMQNIGFVREKPSESVFEKLATEEKTA